MYNIINYILHYYQKTKLHFLSLNYTIHVHYYCILSQIRVLEQPPTPPVRYHHNPLLTTHLHIHPTTPHTTPHTTTIPHLILPLYYEHEVSIDRLLLKLGGSLSFDGEAGGEMGGGDSCIVAISPLVCVRV
jgi:hypothetical protein